MQIMQNDWRLPPSAIWPLPPRDGPPFPTLYIFRMLVPVLPPSYIKKHPYDRYACLNEAFDPSRTQSLHVHFAVHPLLVLEAYSNRTTVLKTKQKSVEQTPSISESTSHLSRFCTFLQYQYYIFPKHPYPRMLVSTHRQRNQSSFSLQSNSSSPRPIQTALPFGRQRNNTILSQPTLRSI